MVQDQYPTKDYSLKSYPVKFVESSGGDLGIGIEVANQDQLRKDGWTWHFENDRADAKVHVQTNGGRWTCV